MATGRNSLPKECLRGRRADAGPTTDHKSVPRRSSSANALLKTFCQRQRKGSFCLMVYIQEARGVPSAMVIKSRINLLYVHT
jgi:hypothetical protein